MILLIFIPLLYFIVAYVIYMLIINAIMKLIFHPRPKKEPKLVDIGDVSDCIELFSEELPKEKKSPDVLSVQIVEPQIDIKESECENSKKQYRPKTRDEYIGQTRAKKAMDTVKKKVLQLEQREPEHVFIDGRTGCGKTTWVEVFANEMGAEKIDSIGVGIKDMETLASFLNKINESKSKYLIWFIDEIHNLKPDLAEALFPVMENLKFTYGNKTTRIRPFMLIGATTEKQQLQRKIPPFLNRFGTHITLERYNEKEMVLILKKYHQIVWNEFPLKNESVNVIASNCKFTPRVGRSMLKTELVEQNSDKTLEAHGVIKDGLTYKDAEILEILSKETKPVGANYIAQRAGLSQRDYEYVYEPFLVERNYIKRTPRRVIDKRGVEFLKEISKIGGKTNG